MDPLHLERLETRGWRLTRDGSTATALYRWGDPDDPDAGWEVQVLHTAGHGCRFVLISDESGLYERNAAELGQLREALADAAELMASWQGEPGRT